MNRHAIRSTGPDRARLAIRILAALALACAAHSAYAQASVREQVAKASGAGAANLALELASQNRHAFSPLEYARLQHAAIAQRLRWSKAETWALTGMDRFTTLDNALSNGWQLLDTLPMDPEYSSLRAAIISDMIYGLVLRGRMQQAINLFERLRNAGAPVHPYVLVAAGDAYSHQENLDRAIACYETALAQAGPGDVDRVAVNESLFYAYLDRGRYEDAEATLDVLDKEAPPYVERSPVAERPNADYATAQRLRAQYLLYTGRTEAGVLSIDAIQHDAPFSSGLRNAAASARLDDGSPREAQARFRTTLRERPDNIEASVGMARTSLALRQYPQAEEIVKALSAHFPESAAIRNLQRDYDVYDSPLVTVDAGGDIGDSGPTATANREWSINTRIYTSPIAYNWRLFFHQYTGRAALEDHNKSRVRNGAGVNYRRGDVEASGEVHQSTGPSGRFGVSGDLAYYPADDWRFMATFDSDSNDLPWKAYQEGIHGWSSLVSVRRQPNERTYVDLTYALAHYSDANTRHQIGATWFQNVMAQPRHSVSLWTSAAYSSNSDNDVSYFSPQNDLTAQVTVMYEWRPWRHGQYAFRQRVYGTAGAYHQQGEGTSPLWEIRLEQAWDLPRQANITYGVGYGRRSYDGTPESRTLLYLSLNIPF